MTKILELHGKYFRIDNDVDDLKEALQKPATEIILEQLPEDQAQEMIQG